MAFCKVFGILSPKLFNEFLSDLPNYLKESNGVALSNRMLIHISYADDIILLAHSATSLQSSITSLHEFCKKWHLIVNVEKTKIMKFGNNRQNQFYYDTQEIEKVESFKYLGHVSTNLLKKKDCLSCYTSTKSKTL